MAPKAVKKKTMTKRLSDKKKPGRPPKNKRNSIAEDGFPGLSDFEGFTDEDGSEKNNGDSQVDASSVVAESVSIPQQQQQPDLVEQLRIEKAKNAELKSQCESVSKEFADFKQSTLERTQHLEAEVRKLVRQKTKKVSKVYTYFFLKAVPNLILCCSLRPGKKVHLHSTKKLQTRNLWHHHFSVIDHLPAKVMIRKMKSLL